MLTNGAPSFGLEGKVAIVTGGAGGIGRAYARALGEAGAAVAVADLNVEAADATAAALADDGIRAIGVGVDIADEDSARTAAKRVRHELGGIDILVNNAALMAEIQRVPLMEIDLGVWDKVMKVNVAGALICSRACVPSMIERGGGKIINQSSAGAWVSGPAYTAYAVSKIAIVSLTHGLARELGPHNINVNAIAPGAVESEAGLAVVPAGSDRRQRIDDMCAMKGSAPPEDLCGALVFLASPASDWVTGQCLNVDGGWVYRY
jgi:NAD(P)-dependent dehydrogenase (short-subunit alcohol dehydrogenase family)